MDDRTTHGLQTPGEEIAFIARLKIKSNPNPKFIGTAEAYFVCHIGPKFQISLIYASVVPASNEDIWPKKKISNFMQGLKSDILIFYE